MQKWFSVFLLVALVLAAMPAPPLLATTPEPTPALSAKVLQPEDLSAYFAQVDPEAFGMDMFSGEFVPDEAVAYLSFEMVMGFTLSAESKLEQATIDAALEDPKILIEEFMGSSNMFADAEEYEELPGLDDIGDASRGITMLTNMGDIKARADFVVFRQESIVAMAFNLYYQEQQPLVSIGYIGRKFNKRIEEALSSEESPAQQPTANGDEMALQPEDMPLNFMQIDPIAMGFGEAKTEDFSPENIFAYMNFQIIVDVISSEVEAFDEALGGIEGSGFEELPGMDDIGDASQGFKMSQPGPMPLAIEVVVFKEGSFAAILINMFGGDQELDISTRELAKKASKRLAQSE